MATSMMPNRLYGTLEITEHCLMFSVFKVLNKTLPTKVSVLNVTENAKFIPLFKRELTSNLPWLNGHGQINNLNATALKLTSLVQEFHQAFPQYKLTKIALVLPTAFLKITKINQSIKLSKVNNLMVSVNEQHINSLNLVTKQVLPNDSVLIDKKTYSYSLDGQIYRRQDLIGKTGHELMTTTLVYAMPQTIVDSYERLLNLANLDCLWITTTLQALYRLLETRQNAQKSVVIANWTAEGLEMGYFDHGYLQKVVNLPEGLTAIKNHLADQLNLSEAIIERYLFKVVDYHPSLNNHKRPICGVWDHQQQILKQFSLGDLQEIISREFQKLYLFALKQLFINTLLPVNLVTYHNGFITKIAGLDQWLAHVNHQVHTFLKVMLLGWGFNYHFMTALGVSQKLEKINNYPHQPLIYTSQGNYEKVDYQPLTHQTSNQTISTIGEMTRTISEGQVFVNAFNSRRAHQNHQNLQQLSKGMSSSTIGLRSNKANGEAKFPDANS